MEAGSSTRLLATLVFPLNLLHVSLLASRWVCCRQGIQLCLDWPIRLRAQLNGTSAQLRACRLKRVLNRVN